ncbi:MAG: ABC transporter substrate-binding protein [bacterium]|nr:ABC transporter substrate-binding protein [bacterium]
MKKLFLLPLFALFLLAGCGGDGLADTIRIGYVGPLTGDGASIGEMSSQTLTDFVEIHPEWAGKKVEVFLEDGKCSGQDAASAATKLINTNKVHVIISGGCSGEGLAIVPIAEKAKVLVLSPTNTSPELTGISPYFFRNAPSDVLGGQEMAKAAANQGFEKVAVITENTDFATAYSDQFKSIYSGEIVLEENYNPDATDYKTILQKVKVSDAQAIVHFNQTPVSAGFVAKQKKELGITLPTFSADATDGDDFYKTAQDAAEGQMLVVTSVNHGDDRVRDRSAAYVAKHGSISFEVYHLLEWDLLGILQQAMEAVGTDADALSAYLGSMSAYDGLSGDIAFDENGDSTIKPSLQVVRDGKLTPFIAQ